MLQLPESEMSGDSHSEEALQVGGRSSFSNLKGWGIRRKRTVGVNLDKEGNIGCLSKSTSKGFKKPL